MKDLIRDFFDVPIALLILGLAFGGAIGGAIFIGNYIYNAQNIAAYQNALETITKCRSSKAGDADVIVIDYLCGNVPSPADFGIIEHTR